MTDTYKDKTRPRRSWPLWRWILTGLNIVALVLTALLNWQYLKGGSMVGCGGGSPCDLVLHSRWSTIAGVLPVSSLAGGVYLAMLVASSFVGPDTEPQTRRFAWRALLVLAGSVAGSAAWFIFLQKWVIGDFCFYCMTTHVIGLLLAALIIWRAIKEFNNDSNEVFLTNTETVKNAPPVTRLRTAGFIPMVSPALLGLVFAGILAASQASFSSTAVYRNGGLQNSLPAIDYHTVPVIGSPDAPYIVNVLFDYECPHCQQLHLMLNEVVRRYGGKLAFALCPTPLNSHCNPYIPRDVDEFENSCELAKIGLAVWLAKHEAFSAFDNWMFTYESGDRWRPRNLESARMKAIELVGKEKFDIALIDPWIEQYVRTCIRIYGQTMQDGNGGVPKMILGSHWVVPEPRNTDDLVMILQKDLGVPKP